MGIEERWEQIPEILTKYRNYIHVLILTLILTLIQVVLPGPNPEVDPPIWFQVPSKSRIYGTPHRSGYAQYVSLSPFHH